MARDGDERLDPRSRLPHAPEAAQAADLESPPPAAPKPLRPRVPLFFFIYGAIFVGAIAALHVLGRVNPKSRELLAALPEISITYPKAVLIDDDVTLGILGAPATQHRQYCTNSEPDAVHTYYVSELERRGFHVVPFVGGTTPGRDTYPVAQLERPPFVVRIYYGSGGRNAKACPEGYRYRLHTRIEN